MKTLVIKLGLLLAGLYAVGLIEDLKSKKDMAYKTGLIDGFSAGYKFKETLSSNEEKPVEEKEEAQAFFFASRKLHLL